MQKTPISSEPLTLLSLRSTLRGLLLSWVQRKKPTPQLYSFLREGADSVVTVAGQDLIAIGPGLGEAVIHGTLGKKSAFIRVNVVQGTLGKKSAFIRVNVVQGTLGKRSAFIRVNVVQAESSSKLSTWLHELFISILDFASEMLLGKMRKTYLQRVEVGVVSLEALAGYGLDLNTIEATAFFSNGSSEDVTGQLDWNVTSGNETTMETMF